MNDPMCTQTLAATGSADPTTLIVATIIAFAVVGLGIAALVRSASTRRALPALLIGAVLIGATVFGTGVAPASAADPCVTQPETPLVCPDGEVLIDGACAVTPPIECADGQVLVNDECVVAPIECGVNEVDLNGSCVCQETFVRDFQTGRCILRDACLGEIFFEIYGDHLEDVCRV